MCANLQHLKLGTITLLLLMNIVRAHTGKQIRLITVHVDQCFEAVLLTGGEEPVYRALPGTGHGISTAVICEEIVQEVITYNLTRRSFAAKSISNKAKVFFQRFFTVYLPNKINELTDDIIIKVVIVADGDNIVCIRNDRLIF